MDFDREFAGYSAMEKGLGEQALKAGERASAIKRLQSAITNFELVMVAKVELSIKPKIEKNGVVKRAVDVSSKTEFLDAMKDVPRGSTIVFKEQGVEKK